ncbi:MAG: helix-turn-helix domain-containing protein [Bosea sp. (in: a-proteobacteria)]
MKPDSPPLITAAQLRAARAFLEVSQGELALAADVGRSAIADYERGARVPHDATLRKIEEALRAKHVELLFDGPKGVGIKVGS